MAEPSHGTGTPELEAEAQRLRSEQGLPFTAIAARLGIGTSTAHEYCTDAETREEYRERRRQRQRAAANTLDRLEALQDALEGEIGALRRKGERDKALVHFRHADRLEEILILASSPSPSKSTKGER